MTPQTPTTIEKVAVQYRDGAWRGYPYCVECNKRITKRHKCGEPGQSLFEGLESARKIINPSYRKQSWANYKKRGPRIPCDLS